MAGSPNSNLSSPPSSTDGGGGADDAPSPSSSNVSSSVATPTRVLRDKRKRGANSDLLARVLTPSTPVTASSAAGSPRASPYGSRTRLPRKSSSQAAIMNAAVAAALNEPLSPGRGDGSPSGGREGTTRSRARDEPVIPTWLVHHADVDKGREAVRALEGLYPKPDPLSNDGWMTGPWKRDTADWMLEVLESTVDSTGREVGAALDSLLTPQVDDESSSALRFDNKPSLGMVDIRQNVQKDAFKTLAAFDHAVHDLFRWARRVYPIGSQEYGDVALLQRRHQQLASKFPTATEEDTNYCSVEDGPYATRSHTSRPKFTPGEAIKKIDYLGRTHTVGDFIHLSNPIYPAFPIVGQIHGCAKATSSSSRRILVCYFNRPEETIHPKNRTFAEGEVFKSGDMAIHQIEDIIEKVSCQFMTKAVKGRPTAPHWYPGWPLYFCESRYDSRDGTMTHVRSWKSCLPESLRSEEQPIHLFESPPIRLARVVSPFMRGVEGIGGPTDAVEEESINAPPMLPVPASTRAVSSVPQSVSPSGSRMGSVPLPNSPGGSSSAPEYRPKVLAPITLVANYRTLDKELLQRFAEADEETRDLMRLQIKKEHPLSQATERSVRALIRNIDEAPNVISAKFEARAVARAERAAKRASLLAEALTVSSGGGEAEGSGMTIDEEGNVVLKPKRRRRTKAQMEEDRLKELAEGPPMKIDRRRGRRSKAFEQTAAEELEAGESTSSSISGIDRYLQSTKLEEIRAALEMEKAQQSFESQLAQAELAETRAMEKAQAEAFDAQFPHVVERTPPMPWEDDPLLVGLVGGDAGFGDAGQMGVGGMTEQMMEQEFLSLGGDEPFGGMDVME